MSLEGWKILRFCWALLAFVGILRQLNGWDKSPDLESSSEKSIYQFKFHVFKDEMFTVFILIVSTIVSLKSWSCFYKIQSLDAVCCFKIPKARFQQICAISAMCLELRSIEILYEPIIYCTQILHETQANLFKTVVAKTSCTIPEKKSLSKSQNMNKITLRSPVTSYENSEWILSCRRFSLYCVFSSSHLQRGRREERKMEKNVKFINKLMKNETWEMIKTREGCSTFLE